MSTDARSRLLAARRQGGTPELYAPCAAAMDPHMRVTVHGTADESMPVPCLALYATALDESAAAIALPVALDEQTTALPVAARALSATHLSRALASYIGATVLAPSPLAGARILWPPMPPPSTKKRVSAANKSQYAISDARDERLNGLVVTSDNRVVWVRATTDGVVVELDAATCERAFKHLLTTRATRDRAAIVAANNRVDVTLVLPCLPSIGRFAFKSLPCVPSSVYDAIAAMPASRSSAKTARRAAPQTSASSASASPVDDDNDDDDQPSLSKATTDVAVEQTSMDDDEDAPLPSSSAATSSSSSTSSSAAAASSSSSSSSSAAAASSGVPTSSTGANGDDEDAPTDMSNVVSAASLAATPAVPSATAAAAAANVVATLGASAAVADSPSAVGASNVAAASSAKKAPAARKRAAPAADGSAPAPKRRGAPKKTASAAQSSVAAQASSSAVQTPPSAQTSAPAAQASTTTTSAAAPQKAAAAQQKPAAAKVATSTSVVADPTALPEWMTADTPMTRETFARAVAYVRARPDWQELVDKYVERGNSFRLVVNERTEPIDRHAFAMFLGAMRYADAYMGDAIDEVLASLNATATNDDDDDDFINLGV